MHYLSHPYNCVLGLMRCSVSIVWHMAEGPWELEQIKEATYTRKRFKWWKKAPKYFEEHQQSKCNTIATVYHVVGPKCKDIAELMRENLNVERAKERYLLDVRAWDIWMVREFHCKVTRVRTILRNWWFFLEQRTKTYEITWISHLEINKLVMIFRMSF